MKQAIKSQIFLLIAVFFLNGCVAVVDEGPQSKRVRSFIVPEKEVLSILQQGQDTAAEKKTEVILFQPVSRK